MKTETAFFWVSLFAGASFTISDGRYRELFIDSLGYGWVVLCFAICWYRLAKYSYNKFWRRRKLRACPRDEL